MARRLLQWGILIWCKESKMNRNQKNTHLYFNDKVRVLVLLFWVSVIGFCVTACTDHGSSMSNENSALSPPKMISVAGVYQDYSVVQENKNVILTKLGGNEGTVLDADLDIIQFQDLDVNLRIQEKANKVSGDRIQRLIALYLVYFGRAPDATALETMLGQVAQGMTIEQVSTSLYSFALKNSQLTGYSVSMTDSAFISLIMRNLFGTYHSQFDPNIQFTKQLQDLVGHRSSRPQFAFQIIETSLSQNALRDTKVSELLQRKIQAAQEFALVSGISGKNLDTAFQLGMAAIRDVTISSNSTSSTACSPLSPAPTTGGNVCLSPVAGSSTSANSLIDSLKGYWFFKCDGAGKSMVMHFDYVSNLYTYAIPGLMLRKTKLRQYQSSDCTGSFTEVAKTGVEQQFPLIFTFWEPDRFGKFKIDVVTQNSDIKSGGGSIIIQYQTDMEIAGTNWGAIKKIANFEFPDTVLKPIADAGLAQSATVGQKVSFDATGSYSTQGLPLTYEWRLLSKPVDSNLALESATGSSLNLVADRVGIYDLELVVSNKGVNSYPSRTKLVVEGTATSERTVVIQVTGTSPAWGQELEPAWIFNSPVKDAPGFAMYDIELGRNSQGIPSYLRLYKADNTHPNFGQTAAYMQSKLLLNIPIASTNNSQSLLNAAKQAVDRIYSIENPTRTVLTYAGHGGPSVFFEGMLSMLEGQEFVSYLRSARPSSTLILDFSTNCDVGYFEFARYFYKNADYLISTELPYGGFTPGDVNFWLINRHASNLHRFFAQGVTTRAALESVAAARRNVWLNSQASIVDLGWQQSVAVYDLKKFHALMAELARDKTFVPSKVLTSFQKDIGTYVLSVNQSNLTNAFLQFRPIYTSDRDMVPWLINTNGFSTYDLNGFDAFLATGAF